MMKIETERLDSEETEVISMTQILDDPVPKHETINYNDRQ